MLENLHFWESGKAALVNCFTLQHRDMIFRLNGCQARGGQSRVHISLSSLGICDF